MAFVSLHLMDKLSRLSPLRVIVLLALVVSDVAAFRFMVASAVQRQYSEVASSAGWRAPRLSPIPIRHAGPGNGHVDALMRPIFSPKRRRLTIEASWPRTEDLTPKGLSLKATVRTHKSSFCLIEAKSFPEGKWILRGEVIEGWSITEINEGKVFLRKGRSEAVLRLDYGITMPTLKHLGSGKGYQDG